jgi:hypothetical protein
VFLNSPIAFLSSFLEVITYPENLQLRELPTRANRDPHEGDESGLAAQAFNVMHERPDYPSYLMGSLVLPPRGIKDPESVGRSAQTFTVVSCQPNALEIAFADPDEDEGSFDPATAARFFLCPDAMFRIPPGNCYRLENHSKKFDAKLTWTILRQNAPDGVVQEAGDNDEEGSNDEEGEEDDDDGGRAASAARGRDDDGDDSR